MLELNKTSNIVFGQKKDWKWLIRITQYRVIQMECFGKEIQMLFKRNLRKRDN